MIETMKGYFPDSKTPFVLKLVTLWIILSINLPVPSPANDFTGALGNPLGNDEVFLRSLYHCFLEREPDKRGFETNLQTMRKGMPRSQVYQMFISFPEYKIMKKGDIEFIRDLYQGVFGREPDQKGANGWLEKMRRGKSRNAILSMMLRTNEYGSIQSMRSRPEVNFRGREDQANTLEPSDFLFYEDFEDTPSWFPKRRISSEGMKSGLTSEESFAGNRCLRIAWSKGEPFSGIESGVYIPNSETAYLRYFCKYPKGFSWNFSHKTVGFRGKLPGTPESSASGGNQVNGRDAFSSRLMISQFGMCFYAYHPGQPINHGIGVRAQKNKFFGWAYTCDVPKWKEGVWHCVEMRMILNTPGKENGSLTAWIDGNRICSYEDVRFRDISPLQINNVMFSLYYGGNWGPKSDTYMLIDEIAVAHQRIGITLLSEVR
jgi:hypothetical protein